MFTKLRPRLYPILRAISRLLLFTLLQMNPAQASDDTLESMPIPILRSEAESLPAAGLYVLAARLFADGRRDEATRWFYVAQIRARYRLATSPDLPPDGEPALYSALQETIGRPINEWAFDDIPAVAARIQEALDWDAAHPNAVTPKTKDPKALEHIRSGLAQMRLEVLADAKTIRQQRDVNGLANR